MEHDRRAGFELNRETLLEKDNALKERPERHGLELRRGQLGQETIGLHEAVERVGAALDNAQAAAKVVQRGGVAVDGDCLAHLTRLAHLVYPRQEAAGDGLDGRQRVRQFMAEHANQPLPGDLFLFLKRQAHIGKQKQRVGRAVLAKEGLAQEPPRGFAAKGVDALVRRGKQIFEAECAGGVAEAAGMGETQQLDPGVVDQLEKIFAVEGKERRVHDLKDAGQQSRGFKRAHALLLQQIGQCVDLRGQFRKRVLRAGAAGAERVIAFAQGGDDIGERLQRANDPFNERRSHQQEVKQQAACEQQRRRESDCPLVEKNRGEDERGQHQQQAVDPRPADSRAAAAPADSLFRGHIFRCGDKARRG